MSVYIEIRDSANSIEGVLDVGDSENFPLSIDMKNVNFANLVGRSGVYSTDFEVPLTDTNSKLFSQIYNVNLKNTKEYFKKKVAHLYYNNVEFLVGKLIISDVKTKSGIKYLSCSFFGDNSEWVKDLKEQYLSDITFDSTALLWSNYTTNKYGGGGNSEIYFSDIDRGLGDIRQACNYTTATRKEPVSNYNIWRFPDLKVKGLIQKIFNQNGYNLDSDFWSHADRDGLLLSFFGDRFKKTDNKDNALVASASSYESFFIGASNPSDIVRRFIRINDDSTGINSDTNNNFDTSTYTYTVPRTGYYSITGSIEFNLGHARNGAILKLGLELPDRLDDEGEFFDLAPENDKHNYTSYYIASTGQTFRYFDEYDYTNFAEGSFFLREDYRKDGLIAKGSLKNVYLEAGEKITLIMLNSSIGEPEYTLVNATLNIVEEDTLVTKNTFNLNNVVDNKNMTLMDFIHDLTVAYNLHWHTNSFTKTVYCEPRDAYYKSNTIAVDMTDSLIIDKYKVTPMKKFFKDKIRFNYANDNSDGYLKMINEQLKHIYGSYRHTLIGDFEDGTLNVSMKKLAPTYFIKTIFGADTNTQNQVVKARIWNKNTEDRPPLNLNHAPRLLYNDSMYTGSASGTHTDDIKPLFHQNYDIFGSAYSHSDFTNLGFANIMGFTGLFSDNWSSTFSVIENSSKLNIDGRIPISKIKKLDFRTPIYFSAPEDIQGYWIINQINNVNFKNDVVSLDLVKTITTEGINVQTETGTGTIDVNLLGNLDAEVGNFSTVDIDNHNSGNDVFSGGGRLTESTDITITNSNG